MIGVGFSQNADTRRAVRDAARAAEPSSGQTGWLIVMVGRRHDPETVRRELAAVFGDIPVFGGACVGAISQQGLGYSGYEIAVTAFDESLEAPEAKTVAPLSGHEHDAGRELGEWITAGDQDRSVLLFYDVVRPGGGIAVGSHLMDGIYESLGCEGPALYGAGLIGDFQVTQSFLFNGAGVERNAVLALRMPAGLVTHTRVMHGCTPVSSIMEITRAEGPRIHEIDGRPALERLKELAGADGQDVALSFSVLLGRRVGDPHDPYREHEFVNRLIIDVNEDDGSVGLFEADLRAGDKVQVMVRNNAFLMESVEKGVAASLQETAGLRRCFALYVDCAGRASIFTGSEEEEAERVVRAIGERVPLMGFYVGRELAPYDGRTRPLDWTGVLVIFSLRG